MNVSSGRTLLRPGFPTLAELLAARGYRCGHFGKWHLGDNFPYRPQDRGFHEAIWYPSSHIGSAPDFWNNHYFDDTYNHNGRREKFRGYTTDVFFNEAMNWMRAQAKAGRPFFCYLATATAHSPYFVPKKYRDLYQGQDDRVARFFAMIANIDENMGRLEAFLREAGLRENTLLIFLTDNGGTAGVPIFNAGMRGRKMDLWDGGHRVPCFIRWPAGGLSSPRDLDELTQVQDIVPTVLDLCGAQPPKSTVFEGVSLAPILRGEPQQLPDRTLFVQFSRMNGPAPRKGDAAVLWRKWRLVRDRELYDLKHDPGQTQNVITRFPAIAARLRADYERWWAEVAPCVNEHSAITIGSNAENPVQLSPADWEDSFLDQGSQVRRGLRRNGVWNLWVEADASFEIELRRWPREVDQPLRAALPPVQFEEAEFPAGVALPIARARVKIGDLDASRAVTETDRAVSFHAKLPRGRTRLQTWFYEADGTEICGAYYVYVTRK
jgi:arylsulfatase